MKIDIEGNDRICIAGSTNSAYISIEMDPLLRKVDRHPFAALTSLILALSCRSCRPHAPFAELICLSDKSIADELHEESTRRVLREH
jgi:hypothetical protein